MNDEYFQRRVGAASVAAWWVVLLAAGLFVVSYVAYLTITPAEPEWLASLWGPGVSWDTIRSVWFWGIAAFKVVVWLMAMGALWLTLWARQLRNQAPRS
jgi:hypothetical protein